MNNSEQINIAKHEELQRLRHDNSVLTDKLTTINMYFQHNRDAMIETNQQHQIIKLNESAKAMLELTDQDAIGQSFLPFLVNVPKSIIEAHFNHLKKEQYLLGEWLLSTTKQKVLHVEFIAVKNAISKHTLYTLRDVSKKKELERENIISRNLFSDVFNRAGDGIVLFTRNGIMIDMNKSFCTLVSEDTSTLIGKSIIDFMEPANRDQFLTEVETLQDWETSNGEAIFTLPTCKKNVEYTTSSNIYSGLYMSIFRDVTEKKAMEEALQKSEEMFKSLFEQATEAIIVTDSNGQILQVNPASTNIFEDDSDTLLASNLLDYIDKRGKTFYKLLEAFKEGQPLRSEMMFNMANGQKKLLEFTTKKLDNNNGHLNIFRNVSERWEMERELRKSEQKFRRIFEASQDGMMIWDKSGKIFDINHTGAEILAISKEEILDNHLFDIAFPSTENKQEICNHVRIMSKNGSHQNISKFSMADGSCKVLDYSSTSNVFSNLNMTIFRDITDKWLMEDQLKKSDTLSVVGELAAGIAHEIRNPMTALKGFIQLLEGSLQGQYNTYFHVISSELQRIETIITDFLVLAKPQAVSYQYKQINTILQNTADLLGAQASMHNVQINLEHDESILPIYCEANKLKQVFINIIKNGIEAMPSGGQIVVKSEVKDHQVMVSIKDRGQGIPQEKLKKLGEPFYTTKEKGTGLGLMVTYKIVKEHRGTIEVESVEGQGTEFKIYLPYQVEE